VVETFRTLGSYLNDSAHNHSLNNSMFERVGEHKSMQHRLDPENQQVDVIIARCKRALPSLLLSLCVAIILVCDSHFFCTRPGEPVFLHSFCFRGP
jgi:hypothetical protein